MSSFLDLVDAVGAYYGTGSDQWQIIAQGGINSPEALDIISQVPGVNVTVSNSGKILGYDFAKDFPNSTPASSAINSNTQTGAFNNSFSSNIPANAVPPSTEVPNGGMNSGAKLTNVGTTVATVADKISLAVAGIALGTKLGKLIDSGIYAFNPQWFDEHFPTLNPETWDDMATTQGGKNFICSLFGLQNDSATMYIDEQLLAYAYQMFLQNGAWDSGGKSIVVNNPTVTKQGTSYTLLSTPTLVTPSFTARFVGENEPKLHTATGDFEICFALEQNDGVRYVYAAKDNFSIVSTINSQASSPQTLNAYRAEFISGYPFYFYYQQIGAYSNYRDGATVIPPQVQFSGTGFSDLISPGNDPIPLLHILLYQSEVVDNPTIEGISENPQAGEHIDPTTVINPTTGLPVTPNDSLQDVLTALKQAYPDLFNGSIYTNVPQPDGTTTTITYIPVPYPNNANTTQPTTDTTPNVNPQTDPQVNPDYRPNSAQNIADTVTSPTNNAPDIGDGTTPPVVPPTGGASSLWAVYNPTQAQVDDFGAWLWSSNFVEQIKKLFADPMQGIIGLHKIFATPLTGAAQNIKVGYLDSGVPSAVVTSQYTDIDCGEVNVSEYFGNVFDYEDTTIRLYLPFIGIVDLSTSDIMRGSVRVVYHVDVITGACLADVIVSRDSAGGVLYQYSGDAAVRYPVSSGSYMGMVNGVLAVVGGVVGLASGGAALPAVMGAVGGVMNSRTSVKHSGSFSGAAGAMGAKIPYLIIERPQSAVANDYANYQGIGDNRVINVGSMNGYFKMTDVHTNGVLHATDEEIEQIKGLLEGGVIQ